jgi:hypothetical protein
MCILGKDKLLDLMNKYKGIYPFDYNFLDDDGYSLTVKERLP